MKYMDIKLVKGTLEEIKTHKGKRMYIGFLLAFWHGLRVSELAALKGKDLKDGYVDVRRLKGSLHTTQRWQKHPDPILDEYGALEGLEIGDEELLVPFTRRWLGKVFKTYAVKAGVNPRMAHPHTLKHSIAMLVIGSGIENTKQRLGHKSLASTGHYLKVSDDKASAAIDAYLGI